jgi:hypothetical protein
MVWSRWLLGVVALGLVGCSLAPGVISVRASMGTYAIKFDSETRIRSALIATIHNTRPPIAGSNYRLTVTGPGYSSAQEYTLTQSTTGVARAWFGNEQDSGFKDGIFAVTARLNNTQLGSALTAEVKRSHFLQPPPIALDLAKTNDTQVVAGWGGPDGKGVSGAVFYYVRLNRVKDKDNAEKMVEFYTRSTSVIFNNLGLEVGPQYFVSINAFNTDVILNENWDNLPSQFNISYSNSKSFVLTDQGVRELDIVPQQVIPLPGLQVNAGD